MTNTVIKIGNKEISTLAAEWLDAVESIPNESIYSKMQVRAESMSLWNMFRTHSDVLANGDVSIVLSGQDMMDKSKTYALFVHSLPENIRSLFNEKFETFWDSICSHVILD
jgi:hypothetical protein